MKKSILWVFAMVAITAYSQKSDLTTVNTVRPKNGQKMAFEAAYKVHIAKFHKTVEKIYVYEILSGPDYGCYHLVQPGRSFADFDKPRTDATAHNVELDKNFYPFLQEAVNGTYRSVDSLSFHNDIQAEKFVLSRRQLKLSLLGDYKKEIVKTIKVYNKIGDKFIDSLSLTVFEELWTGSNPILVTIRNLKDGFKSLETDYYGVLPPNGLKDAYIKEYGAEEWDKRVKLIEDVTVRNDVYIMKYRKDLSSE